MSERPGSTDLERGPWRHNRVDIGFGVSWAARLPIFQMNGGVLRRSMAPLTSSSSRIPHHTTTPKGTQQSFLIKLLLF